MTPSAPAAQRPRPAPLARRRPAHMHHLAHTFACADCRVGLACRTERTYARRAEIEDAARRGWAPDAREWGGWR